MIRFVFIIATVIVGYEAYNIGVSNGHKFGDWGKLELCPGNHPAIGFSLKVQSEQGSGDDTAVNAIPLKCADGTRIHSSRGRLGFWTPTEECSDSRLKNFQLRVEFLPAEIGYDTAVNDINFICTNGDILYGNSRTSWGEWGYWSSGCRNGIRGIVTKVEKHQGSGDDTALNDVEFVCF